MAPCAYLQSSAKVCPNYTCLFSLCVTHRQNEAIGTGFAGSHCASALSQNGQQRTFRDNNTKTQMHLNIAPSLVECTGCLENRWIRLLHNILYILFSLVIIFGVNFLCAYFIYYFFATLGFAEGVAYAYSVPLVSAFV